MTFKFKLSKRLAQSWDTNAVLIATSCLPLSRQQTAALVAVSLCPSIRSSWASEGAH